MFIAKPKVHHNWFSILFPWLERCEKILVLKILRAMKQKDFTHIWQKDICHSGSKYTKSLEWPWVVKEHE